MQILENPKRIIAIALAAIFGMGILLMFVMPNGFAPSMAESSVNGGVAEISFQSGDRYFWVEADLATGVKASDILALIPGDQTIIEHYGPNPNARLAYDETKNGPDDFGIKKNRLFEVNGVFDDVVMTFDTQGIADGKGFVDELQEDVTGLAERIWVLTISSPGIIWENLVEIGSDFGALFAESPSDGARSLKSFEWQSIIVVGFMILLLPLLGFDNLWTGFIGGAIMAASGHWVIAGMIVAAGWFTDNNAGPMGPSKFGLKYWIHAAQNSGEVVVDSHPRAFGAIIFYVAGLVGALVTTRLGLPNIAMGIVLVSAVLGTAIVFLGARTHSGRIALSRVGRFPAISIFVMGWVSFAILLMHGYRGFATAIVVFTVLFGALYAHYAWRASAAEKLGSKYIPYNERQKLKKFYGERHKALTYRTKVLVYGAIGTSVLLMAAILDGQWLAASFYLLISAVAWMLIPMFRVLVRGPSEWKNQKDAAKELKAEIKARGEGDAGAESSSKFNPKNWVRGGD